MSRWIWNRTRTRLAGEDGFSLVEGIIAVSVLAVGMLAIAQAMTFSLHSSGLARQRLGARAAIEQQMELARALNHETLVLSDTSPIPHETDPDNPDYWVDFDDQTYDPDGIGPLGPEEIVREPGANPSLQHYQAPVISGDTTFAVYMYVTWVDGDEDGLAAADADGDTHDAKRVTVVITWRDPIGGELRSSQMTSLFSEGTVPYQDTQSSYNQNPTVACPTTTSTDLSYSFAVDATDTDGTISTVYWAIEGYGAANGWDYYGSGPTYAVNLDEEGPYRVLTTVYDDDGGSADNALLACEITAATTSNNMAGNGGPSGTISINADATYANTTQVSLTLACGSCSGGSKMQFSTDGSTWTDKVTYATTSLFTLNTGDGTKTVYARFWSAGKYGPWSTDTITLDTVVPNGPTSLFKYASQNQGNSKNVTFQWTLPSPLSSDTAGYRIYYRATTSTGSFTAATCTPVLTNRCTVTNVLNKNASYQTYLVYYDNAGNESAASNTITV